MSVRALQYVAELDPSKPLCEQWGGRFLTQAEGDELFETVRLGQYEYVAMNVEHYANNWEYHGGLEPVAMSDTDAIVLFETAHDLRQIAERATQIADKIEYSVRHLRDGMKEMAAEMVDDAS